MTDITAGQTAGGFRLPGIGSLGDLAKRGDLALAVGVLTILMVLILPLPAILLLDFYLVRFAFGLLTAILPTALGAYLAFNYAATLALLLALTYAAIPIFV